MKQQIEKFLVFTTFIYITIRSCIAFHHIAWDSGAWLGKYLLTWGGIFVAYTAASAVMVIFAGWVLWRKDDFASISARIIQLREKIGWLRWILAASLLIFPVWFLQYTPWGVVFENIYIRVMLWIWVVLGITLLATRPPALLGWGELLGSLTLTSSAFVIAYAFINVTDYPFSQGWSEGNRIWDYSMLFASHLYDIPSDTDTKVLLEIGRQIVGGLPFLIPNLTIEMERLWLAFTTIAPYLLAGLALFYRSQKVSVVFLITLWVLVFLKQGPIHPPLVIAAATVAFAWRKPLWAAIPLVFLASYYARISRYTWMFAPGVWIGMLEIACVIWKDKISTIHSIKRAGILGLTGIVGGVYGPQLFKLINNDLSASSIKLNVSATAASGQALLWERLLPNATYGNGILLGTLIATLPLITLLVYLASEKKWQINILQKMGLIAPLLAFLTIGIIASAKIGGGGDLHNMDMFLIGLMFSGALAWYNGGGEWMQNAHPLPFWNKMVIVLLIALPALSPLRELYPQQIDGDADWLVILADKPDEKSLEMLPNQKKIDGALYTIQNEISLTKEKGDILFIDQRQLLTFGYIKDVTLVPEYEKKVLINEAMRSNTKYFEAFYKDLAAQRFSLIISQPLHQRSQDEGFVFDEENNAWIEWVSKPILCYYERQVTISETGIQLLTPITPTPNCSTKLPVEILP
jgi:hypothetical protein